jgi:uncharacterized membrane protein
MRFLQANTLSFIVLGLMIIATLVLYGDLPDRIPTNYDFDGVARSDSPKLFIAVLIPSIYILVIVGINFLINISPEKYSMPNSKRAMDIIVFAAGLLVACIHLERNVGGTGRS